MKLLGGVASLQDGVFRPTPPKKYSLGMRRWHELRSNRDSATAEPAYVLEIPTLCSSRRGHCRQQSLDSKGAPSETHGFLCLISCLSRRFSKSLTTIETSNSYAGVHCRAIPFWGDAVPFTNQTRLIFEPILPLLPHRRRIPSPLSQSMRRSSSPPVASRERGQNTLPKKGQSVKPDSCINLRRSKIPPECPDGA